MTDMKPNKGLDKGLEGMEPVIPRLVPCPCWCRGTEEPVICLDGEWTVRDFADNSVRSVQVPLDMVVLRKQGFSRHYQYEREIRLPRGTEGNRFVLRFEGVNGFASVYLDDMFVAEHQNGFLTWNVDITDYVEKKSRAALRVVMDEESDQVSAYSHGGILHSVYLYVLPQAYVDAVYMTPLFDEDMEHCTLRVDMGVSSFRMEPAGCEALLRLYDPHGQEILMDRSVLDDQAGGYFTRNLPVPAFRLWDSEHPEMYTLEIELLYHGERLETVRRKTGLRKLERKGNRLFVNRQEIKLRGACRHEIAPLTGRAMTRELIEEDVALFKEANCNYIRTSHYPPSEYFLELCDEHGIYVEDELALAFIARTLPYTQRDPEQTQRYLSHFTECLARDYNHPSVIIWSLCNESFGGYNFDVLNRYVHRKDPTRMTKFSYPMTIREEHEMPDIWSIHYSEYNADLAKKRDNVSVGHAPGRDMPVLHDEYVHVACYNREEHRRDPNVRSFWGKSIEKFWDNIWNTEGALGGAIWAGIDETDVYVGGNTQLEWGIIDVWRRRKPEFFMTRKAYTPIKVLHTQVESCAGAGENGRVILILENRFFHTDFKEVVCEWNGAGITGSCRLPEAPPRMTVKAQVMIPFSAWRKLREEAGRACRFAQGGEEKRGKLELVFRDASGAVVEELLLCLPEAGGAAMDVLPPLGRKETASAGGAEKTENGFRRKGADEAASSREELVLENSLLRMVFSGETGLVKELTSQGKRLLTGGPYLNVPYLKLGAWYLTSLESEIFPGGARVRIRGGYEKTLTICWLITVYEDGRLDTSYTIEHLEKFLPKQLKLRVGVDCGGLDELGVYYLTDPAMDTLSWRREGDFTVYPEDHISRNQGTASRACVPDGGREQRKGWGQKPEHPWSQDMKNDVLNGCYDVEYKGTNDFRSTKENVIEAYLYEKGHHINGKYIAVGVVRASAPSREISVRMEVQEPEEWKITDRDPRIRYQGVWYLVEDKKESDHGTEMWSHEKGAYAECTFNGTGIVWYGPQDTTYGMANVYIDGQRKAERISQRVAGVDFSCSSVGYDKKYHYPVFSITDLPPGEHTIRIEVCGEKAEDSSDTYIVIDYLRVLNGERTEPVKFIINHEFAYPHLSWGNYCKEPILIQDGYHNTVHMQIAALPDCPQNAGNGVDE